MNSLQNISSESCNYRDNSRKFELFACQVMVLLQKSINFVSTLYFNLSLKLENA